MKPNHNGCLWIIIGIIILIAITTCDPAHAMGSSNGAPTDGAPAGPTITNETLTYEATDFQYLKLDSWDLTEAEALYYASPNPPQPLYRDHIRPRNEHAGFIGQWSHRESQDEVAGIALATINFITLYANFEFTTP